MVKKIKNTILIKYSNKSSLKLLILLLLLVSFLLISISDVAATGCYIDWNKGNPGCRAVNSWGNNVNINDLVKQAAKNNPGIAYMGWCPYDGATPYARVEKPECDCPDLKPKAGECVSGTCGACGNPVTKCAPETPSPKNYCGDGKVSGNEKCEYPNTFNNQNCAQSTTTCSGKKTGTRDAFGDCNSQCGCNYDTFNYQCIKGSCGAQCSTNNDCNDNNPYTQDLCNSDCGCEHIRIPRCGDGIKDETEECDDGNTNNNDGCLNNCKIARCGDSYVWTGKEQCEFPNTINNPSCSQSTTTCSGKKTGTRDAFGDCNSQCGCNYDTFNYQCIKGSCGAQCSTNNDCNDNNPKTQDICNQDCGCEHITLCTDECKLGETKCFGSKIYVCENFDSDPCLEWGFQKECYYEKESAINYVCENDDSIAYKIIETGYCKDVFGNNDYCDSKTEKKIISQEDCGTTSCTKTDECNNNEIFEIEKCTLKGCDNNNGKCYSSQETKLKLKEDCGTDICVSYTERDIFKQESIEDFEGCNDGNSYCDIDPGKIYDVCISDKILNQVYCNGNDYAFDQFDCSSLSGCYDFEYTFCVYCPDEYGNCEKTNCIRTGKEYRNYYCGSGSCKYNVSPSIDVDKDKIDDRCDSCIDVDKDGICDDNDNCIGIKNPNQIDKDNDGIGDVCDNDRDNDGYNADLDCNDWNPNINPGMKEILNNGIDDDCNPETKDIIANEPRELLYVDMITDQYSNSDDLTVIVSITNLGNKDLKNVDIKVSLPNLQLYQQKYIYKLGSKETITRFFIFKVDKKTLKYEYLKLSISSGEYKRQIYREIEFN